MGLEPTTVLPAPVFETGSSSGRMTSVCKFRGLESNQHRDVQSGPSLPVSTDPGSVCFWTHRLSRKRFGEKELNLHHLVQSQAAYR